MAHSPLANDPGELYSELERAYTEDRWADVLKQGERLIAHLNNQPDPVTGYLASRAHLLLGHAHLYGLRDPAAALPHYQAVLAEPQDPDLQRIAEEALPYCQPPNKTVTPAATAATPTVMAQELDPWTTIDPTAEPGPAQPAITEAATPWLNESIQVEKSVQTEAGAVLAARGATGQEVVPSLEVEVVEEPELVEVAQADPSLAEELNLELTRIREQRAARRGDGLESQELVNRAPASGHGQRESDDLMEDPELLAGLLRVVVKPLRAA